MENVGNVALVFQDIMITVITNEIRKWKKIMISPNPLRDQMFDGLDVRAGQELQPVWDMTDVQTLEWYLLNSL
jgi:hypothetical protein